MFTNEWPSPELLYSGDGRGGDGGGGQEAEAEEVVGHSQSASRVVPISVAVREGR